MNLTNIYEFQCQLNKSAGKKSLNSYKILRKIEIENR